MNETYVSPVQPEPRRSWRWVPIVLLSAAGMSAGVAAGEQIASKPAEFKQTGILMNSGNLPVAGFDYRQANLTPDVRAKVEACQDAIDARHHDRDLSWHLAIDLAEAAIAFSAIRTTVNAFERHVLSLTTTPASEA